MRLESVHIKGSLLYLAILLLFPINIWSQPELRLQTLEVVTNPSNAHVAINGYEVGRSPYEIKLRPGTYNLKVSLPGYNTYEEELELKEEDERQVISLTLMAKPARLTVTTSADVQVFINDELANIGSFQTELEPGNYSLKFMGELYDTVEQNIRLLPEMNKIVKFTPEMRYGQLVVKTKPKGATLFLNGKRIGVSTTEIEKVRLGVNQIEAVLEGYNHEERLVRVENTRTSVVKIKMVKSDFQSQSDPGTTNPETNKNKVIKPLSKKQEKRREKRNEVRNPLSWKYHALAINGVLGVAGYGVELAYLNKLGGYVLYTSGEAAEPSHLTIDQLSSLGGGVIVREGVFGKKNRGTFFLQLGAGVELKNTGHYFELGQYINFGSVTASFGVCRMFFDYNPAYFRYNDEIKIRVGLGVAF